VLNTIVAEALENICTELEAAVGKGKDFNESLQAILLKIVKKHKRILYNGDNYTEEWHKEAEKRGLPNLKTTPEALKEMITESGIRIFEKHKVLSKTEVMSRYEIYKEQYEKTVKIEAGVALEMAKTLIAPAVARYESELAQAVSGLKENSKNCDRLSLLLTDVSNLAEKMLDATARLEKVGRGDEPADMIEAMSGLRLVVDSLEEIMPRELWPLPSYAEMMFII
jgi:glutamine synthetase